MGGERVVEVTAVTGFFNTKKGEFCLTKTTESGDQVSKMNGWL
jgi:hypothetical protein